MALLDLDWFKAYNDSRGHAAGDDLLRQASLLWSRCLPSEGGFLARYGGEEFAVLLRGMSLPTAVTTLDELRQATPQGQSISVGVATFSAGLDAREALARADRALYAAKAGGRNRVLVDESSAASAAACAVSMVESIPVLPGLSREGEQLPPPVWI